MIGSGFGVQRSKVQRSGSKGSAFGVWGSAFRVKDREGIKYPESSFTLMLHKQYGKELLMVRYHSDNTIFRISPLVNFQPVGFIKLPH